MNIIVNADDFGRDNSRNAAINYSMINKYCSQTSIMVNMDKFSDEAVELAKMNGYADRVCLHLNLTLGKPLTDEITDTSLCDSYGNFKFICIDSILTTLKHNMSIKDIRAIRVECEAQIKKFMSYGFTQKHIDSHNWIHLHLPVWLALCPLLKKYDFRSIRPLRPNLMKTGRKKHKLYYNAFNCIFRISRFHYNNYASNFEEFIEANHTSKNETYEIFTHPNFVNENLLDCSCSYKGNDYIKMSEVHKRLLKYGNMLKYSDINDRR